MSDLLHRLDRELYRVSHEVRCHEVDARGLTLNSGLEGVDIYGHPSALMHFRRELEVFASFRLTDPKRSPPSVIGKYRDCWVFSDSQQPEGALIIRHNGNVYADVPIEGAPDAE